MGPIELDVPRDRAGSFEPVIVPKRRRRLNGVDALVCSLSAKGLTHGEICAHLREVYGAEVSKETITRITDRVIEGMTAWQNRPLDPVYPVIFVDAIYVKIRKGQVANRPIYVVVGVTVDGKQLRTVHLPSGWRAARPQPPGDRGRVIAQLLGDLNDGQALASQSQHVHVLLLGQHGHGPSGGIGAWSPETLEGPPTQRVDPPLTDPEDSAQTANFDDHRTRTRVITDPAIR